MKFTLPLLFVALVLIPPSVGFADENLFKREKEIIYREEARLGYDARRFSTLGQAQ